MYLYYIKKEKKATFKDNGTISLAFIKIYHDKFRGNHYFELGHMYLLATMQNFMIENRKNSTQFPQVGVKL